MTHRHTLLLHARPMHRRSQKKTKGPVNTAATGSIRPDWVHSHNTRASDARAQENTQTAKKKVTRSASYDTVPDSEDPIEEFSDPVRARVLPAGGDHSTVRLSPWMLKCADSTPTASFHGESQHHGQVL
jgi:hypothetical protein